MEDGGSTRSCHECGKPVHRWSRCGWCGETFCLKHASPQRHRCAALKVVQSAAHRRKLAVVAAVIVSAVIFAGLIPRARRPASEAMAWIYSDKLRAAYCPDPLAYLDNLSRAGFNAIIQPVARGPLPVDQLREIGQRCKEKGLHYFVSIYWLQRSYLGEGKWRKSVTKDGFVGDYAPPCPLDEGYVSAIITNQTLAVAEVSKECNVAGIMYDAELYGAWPTRYSNLTCFCDSCFYGFMRSIGHPAEEIDKDQRYGWLVDAGVLDHYHSYLEGEATKMFSKVAREARKRDPDLAFGVLGNPLDNWYVEAMAKAFSGDGLPFIVLDESTYRFGFSGHFGGLFVNAYELPSGLTYAEAQVRRIRERKLNVVWAGGVELIRWFYPITVPYHLYSLAIYGGGYWLFYLCPETATSAWWEAYRMANGEIEQTLRIGDRPSPFHFNPNTFDPVEAIDLATNVRGLVPLNQAEPAPAASIRLSGLNTAVIFAKSFQVEIGVDAGTGPPCLAALFDYKGSLMTAAEVDAGSRRALSARTAGVVVDNASVPAPTILRVNSSLPYLLSIQNASWSLIQPVHLSEDADFYWMPPSNETHIQVFCTGEAAKHAYLRIVCGETLLADMPARETLSFPVFEIPSSQIGKICKISVQNVTAPLSLSLRSWAPYLALTRGGSLVPAFSGS